MANSLTPVMGKILARALKTLRPKTVMPILVNKDYSDAAAQKGDVVNIPVPTAMTAIDVVPNNVAPQPADVSPNSVQLTLNNWKEAPFALSDRDLMLIDRDENFIPMELGEAVNALANAVNGDIFSQYKKVFGFTGTPGTTPFATDVSAAVNARKLLQQQKVPLDNRYGVLDFNAEGNAMSLAPFRDASQSDDRNVVIEGAIGRKFGIEWYADDIIPTHTAGTASGFTSQASTTAAGQTSVPVITGTGTFVVGDIVSFAGNSQTYAVTSALSGPGTLNIYPALVAPVAASSAVTRQNSHLVNLVFHRDAFAFAARPLAQTTTDLALGNQIMTMIDPLTGIPLRLEISREYKQTRYSLDILFGSALVRPELAVRIAG